MPATASPPRLVARHVDGLLVGWLAVGAWVLSLALPRTGVVLPHPVLLTVAGIGGVVTAAHFGLSYHLAYGDGTAAARRRPVALVWAPLALAVGLAVVAGVTWSTSLAAAHALVSASITLVFLLTTWHYVKQVYGVGRVGAGFAGIRVRPGEAHVLRYGLYPLWALGAAQVLVGGAHDTLAGYRFGIALLPASSLPVLRGLALLAAVPIAVVVVRASRRARRSPPSTMVAAYLAAFLWLAVPVNPIVTLLVLAPFHALQYLAIGHRAEVALARSRGQRIGSGWWLNIFVGAACGGLLLARWLPRAVDHWLAGGGALLGTAVFFVFLNLHHYLIDATIWRSDGDLLRAISGRGRAPAGPGAAVASAQPVTSPTVAVPAVR